MSNDYDRIKHSKNQFFLQLNFNNGRIQDQYIFIFFIIFFIKKLNIIISRLINIYYYKVMIKKHLNKKKLANASLII